MSSVPMAMRDDALCKSGSEITAAILDEFKAAEQRPRLTCHGCRNNTVLDVRLGLHNQEPLCDACQIRRDEWEQHKARQKAFHKRQADSGLPEEYHTLRLADYTPERAPDYDSVSEHIVKQRQDIFRYFDQFGKSNQPQFGAFITGPAGTGKTMLTAMLANRMIYNGYGVIWVNGFSLDRQITSEWKETSRERAHSKRLAEEIAEYEAVFIEDLQIPGKDPYAWYVGAVNDILNEISIAKRLLFVTTNHRRKRELITENGKAIRGQDPELYLERAYGEKFLSRIDSLCKRFPLSGPDMRQRP